MPPRTLCRASPTRFHLHHSCSPRAPRNTSHVESSRPLGDVLSNGAWPLHSPEYSTCVGNSLLFQVPMIHSNPKPSSPRYVLALYYCHLTRAFVLLSIGTSVAAPPRTRRYNSGYDHPLVNNCGGIFRRSAPRSLSPQCARADSRRRRCERAIPVELFTVVETKVLC